MKKLFFTAIALVAFSAGSMANSIEIEEVVKVSCMQVYTETYDEFVALGLENEAAGEVVAAYGACLSGN